jgi:hypothetical protein
MKNNWDKTLVSIQRVNNFRILSKSELVDLLCSVWHKSLTPANIKAGFLACGIVPVDRSKYPTIVLDVIKLTSYNAKTRESGGKEINCVPADISMEVCSTPSPKLAIAGPSTTPQPSPSLQEVSLISILFNCRLNKKVKVIIIISSTKLCSAYSCFSSLCQNTAVEIRAQQQRLE